METFPQFDLFPRITKAAEGVKKVLRLGRVTELCLAEHKPSEPVTQPELPFDTSGKLAR